MEPVLQIKPRYYRWHVDAGLDWLEENTGYAHLDWQIPLSQAGLVLVDVWDRHYLKDIEARAEAIIQENIRPLLQTCRRSGLEIIHAPAPPQAQKSPESVLRSISSASCCCCCLDDLAFVQETVEELRQAEVSARVL